MVRACFIDPFQGGVLARFALENLKAKKAAVLYDVASDYNKGIAEVFREKYEKLGGKIVAFETYTTTDKDFSAQLTKIKDAKPDVIFLPNYYSEVPLQVQQAKRLGIDVPFIGSDSWGSNELLTLGGADLNGYYFSTHYAADNAAPVAKKFIEDYEKTYGAKPDDVAALTYDAFGLLFGSIKSAGKADREAIRAALSTLPELPRRDRRHEVPGRFARSDQERGDPPDQGRQVHLLHQRQSLTGSGWRRGGSARATRTGRPS